jgi:hypothetical protein
MRPIDPHRSVDSLRSGHSMSCRLPVGKANRVAAILHRALPFPRRPPRLTCQRWFVQCNRQGGSLFGLGYGCNRASGDRNVCEAAKVLKGCTVSELQIDPDAFRAFERAAHDETAEGSRDFFTTVTCYAIEPLLESGGVRAGFRPIAVCRVPTKRTVADFAAEPLYGRSGAPDAAITSPRFNRFRAIGAPIVPSPMNPIVVDIG